MNEHGPEISIIVPVYNVECFLLECLDSIMAQTFTDYELILVDDGSKDNSGRICDEYAEQDERVVVIHQQNGGISKARNAGLDIARGRFICFIDSDDFVAADYLELLHTLITEYDADISICSHHEFTRDFSSDSIVDPVVFTTDTQGAIRLAMEAEITGMHVYDKLYKAELINDLRFQPGKYCEDTYYTIKAIDRCTKAVITDEKKYFYRHRRASMSKVNFSERDFDGIEADQQNYELVAEKYPAILDAAELRRCWGRLTILQKEMLSPKRDANIEKELVSFIRPGYLFIMRNKNFSRKRKIAVTALMINKELYRLCAKADQRKQEAHCF